MRFAIVAALIGCGPNASEAIEREGAPPPVICFRKNTLDMCRDKSGAFWICDGLKPARCLRVTDPAVAFTTHPVSAEVAP